MALQIPAFCNDLAYPFWALRKHIAVSAPIGALTTNDMFVSASGMQVTISSGTACIKQTVNVEGGTAYNGTYLVINDAPANPYNTITAPVSNPRVDQVIARVYDVNEQGLSGSSFARFEWLTGAETAGANLTNLSGVATLPDNSLRLAYVLQTVGEGGILGGNILNLGSAWIPLILASGISAQNAGRPPSVKLINGVVFFRGGITNTSGASKTSGTTLATIPSGYAPSVSAMMLAIDSSFVCHGFFIDVTGAIVVNTGYTFPNATNLYFDNGHYAI